MMGKIIKDLVTYLKSCRTKIKKTQRPDVLLFVNAQRLLSDIEETILIKKRNALCRIRRIEGLLKRTWQSL